MSPFEEGVDPVRLASILERREILQRFCAIEQPSAAEAASHADELGVSVGRLHIMAKAWRLLPELKKIGGAHVKHERKPKLAKQVVSMIEEAIASTGAGASATKIHAEVLTACEEQHVDPPTLSAVHERVMKARSRAAPDDRTHRYSVFQCRVDLPVQRSGVIFAPYITAVLDLPSKRIRNEIIAMGTPATLEGAIESLLEEEPETGSSTPILVPTKRMPDLSKRFGDRIRSAGRNNTASALLGRRIDTLPILHRTYPGADAKLVRKTVGRLNSALTEAEALTVVSLAINAHNRSHEET